MAEEEQREDEIIQELSPPRTGGLFRRVGCIMALVIWFVLLLLPCFFIVLATQNEIIISQGSLPNQEIRILLLMDADKRGIFVSTTSVHSSEVNLGVCLQTDVSYLLWQGSAEASVYCECYEHAEEDYTLVEFYTGSCLPE